MIRVLTIDGNRSRAQDLAMECLEHGVAVRMAESLCEGVRYMLDSPVSLVLAEAGMLRMAGPDQARTVAGLQQELASARTMQMIPRENA